MRLAGSVLVTVFSFLGVIGQSPEEFHSRISLAASERRYASALEDLAQFRRLHPQLFLLNNYEYLVGRLNEKAGVPAAAASAYLAVAAGDSVLRPYALFRMAKLARSNGDLMLERAYLDELATFWPDTVLADAATNRLARSYFESGNFDLALDRLEAIDILWPGEKSDARQPDPIVRENILFAAKCELIAGKFESGRARLESLVGSSEDPTQPDDAALEAVRELDKIDGWAEAGQKPANAISLGEHFQRASVYQFNRNFAAARLHYTAVVTAQIGDRSPEALFQIGRGYAQESNYSEALKAYERILEQFHQHPSARDALLQAASAYSRVGKGRESIRRYQEYISKYPNDERVDRAYLNIIDVLRDDGEEIEALKWAQRTQEVFRGRLGEAQALFAEARMLLARSDWDNAVARLERLKTLPELGGASVPGGTTHDEILFLRAFALEQKRSFVEAVDAYLEIPDGRGRYYGWRANERLAALAKTVEAQTAVREKFDSLYSASSSKDVDANRRNLQAALRLTADPRERQQVLDSLRKAYAALPLYRKLPEFKRDDSPRRNLIKRPRSVENDDSKTILNELLFLGLYDESSALYETIYSSSQQKVLDTKAVLNDLGGRAHRSLAIVEPAWRSVPADYQVELIPPASLRLLYPAPYADEFVRHSVSRKIDPRFLLSLVRQESRFQPDIKSYAAARGLMQFISTTAERTASKLELAGFEQDELYEPSTSILFGSQYVAELFNIFPNQPEAVAASYNGGEDNMRRWFKRAKSEAADRYVPEIAFAQSKDYVFKVMTNFRVYRLLYSEVLEANSPS